MNFPAAKEQIICQITSQDKMAFAPFQVDCSPGQKCNLPETFCNRPSNGFIFGLK
jgi:hypothetical protein